MTVALPEIPGFHIEECLGVGGMGVFYKARREADGEVLAIKMILTTRRPTHQQLARFRIEAEALACLRHRHVVMIRGVGVYSGSPYYVLEFAQQGTLKEHIARGPLPPGEAATLAKQIASALQHAHSRGILHRDLKPANVLMMQNGCVKVSDFGLVKFLHPVHEVSELHSTMSTEDLGLSALAAPAPMSIDDRQATDAQLTRIAEEACLHETTRPMGAGFVEDLRSFLTAARDGLANQPELDRLSVCGQILGSPSYMAPEQAAGRIDDRWELIDVYAIGVILYEMLTGRTPFRAGSLEDSRRSVFLGGRSLQRLGTLPRRKAAMRSSAAVVAVRNVSAAVGFARPLRVVPRRDPAFGSSQSLVGFPRSSESFMNSRESRPNLGSALKTVVHR